MKSLKEHKEIIDEAYQFYTDADTSRWGIDHPELVTKARTKGHKLAGVAGALNPYRDWTLVSLNNFDKKYTNKVLKKAGEKLYRIISTRGGMAGIMPLVKLNAKRGFMYFLNDRSNTGEIDEPEFDKKPVRLNWLRLRKGLREDFDYENLETLDEISGKQQANFNKKFLIDFIKKQQKIIKETEPWTKKGEYRDLAKGVVRDAKAVMREAEAQLKTLAAMKEETGLDEAVAGWIAIYNRKKLEIKKGKDAKDLYSAKQFAIKHFKVPKSKQGLLAIKPGYNEEFVIENIFAKTNIKFSPMQMKQLKSQFGKMSKLDPSSQNYKRFVTVLDKMPDNLLKDIYDNKVKFAWSLAMNRLMKRGWSKKGGKLVKESSSIAESRPLRNVFIRRSFKKMGEKNLKVKDMDPYMEPILDDLDDGAKWQSLAKLMPSKKTMEVMTIKANIKSYLAKNGRKMDNKHKVELKKFIAGMTVEEEVIDEKKKFNFDKKDDDKDKDAKGSADDKDGDGLDDVKKGELKGDVDDRKDKDIDNDGDSDKSDEFLHKRRKAVSKAIAKKSKKKNEAVIDEKIIRGGQSPQEIVNRINKDPKLKNLKPWSKQIGKMKVVDRKSLEKLLPDYIDGGDLTYALNPKFKG